MRNAGPTLLMLMPSPRFAGRTAIAAALIGVAITPFMASVWVFGPLVYWDSTSLLTRLVGPTLESWGALSFGAENTPYEVYGKAFVLVYLLMLPIVRYVQVLHRESSLSKLEPNVWRFMWIALITAAVGDGVSYWGISVPDPVGQVLWRGGFLIEALALLVVLVSTTVYGIVSMRTRLIPIWASILLTAVIPIGVGTLVVVSDYLPNAFVVPMSIIWALVGAWVLISHVQQPTSASQPSSP